MEERDVRTNELQHVEVSRDDEHLPALTSRLLSNRSDDIVRLIARRLKQRKTEGCDQVAHEWHLRAQLIWH